jgi:tetratricopeptide (TPR) repeat protein
MYRKNFIVSLFALVVFLAGVAAVTAQTAPVRGKVELVKADNTRVPVAEVIVSGYRTDTTRGKLPSAKTDKKGNFSFAGIPLGQTFVLVAAGPGVKAAYYPNVKAGMENILIEVQEGDGVVPSEEQVRQVLSSAAVTTPAATTRELTEEEKKKQEEIAKQNAEINARNEKIKKSNEVINQAINEGKKAFDAGDLDTAIAKFDEGYNADPDFAGTAPVFLNNKADVLKQRAVNNYRKSTSDTANKATLLEATKKDLQDSIASAKRAIEILKTAAATDASAQKGYESNRLAAHSIMTDAYRLLIETRTDADRTAEASQAIGEYLALETDPAKKTKAQMMMADAFRKVGNSDLAIPLYRQVLETSPDNADALAGLGLSLFNSGVIANNKEQMQEGLNIMQRFADSAPDTHSLKQSVKEAVDYLKTQEKLTPQKTTRPAATTRKKT